MTRFPHPWAFAAHTGIERVPIEVHLHENCATSVRMVIE